MQSNLTKAVLLTVIIALLGLQQGWAQRFVVKGQVMDSTSGSLPGTTIMLLNKADSSLAGFAAGNMEGLFELRCPSPGPFLLKISYTGYLPFYLEVEKPAESNELQIGRLYLTVHRKELDEVVIEGEADPIKIKEDTIEYYAGSFKVTPNANVEDLLKKLPGVEVDEQGNVSAQGKTVQRVLVDGKDFFGGRDPKMATKNLPADAVDKVQVFEKKSDVADFTGIDDGVREQTINLELKADRKNGSFGKVEAGVGDSDRYKLRANLNRFSKGNQLSVIGMSNNINEQGFSIQDYLNFSGGVGGGRINIGSDNAGMINFGQRQNGIMETYSGGVNINQSLTKRTELNASYFYNQLNHDLRTDMLRENFLPSGSFFSTEEMRQNNTNFNHRANMSLDHKIDSANSIKLTTTINFNETLSSTRSVTESFRADSMVRQNTGDRRTESAGSNLSSNNSLLYRHRFAKRGRTFTTNLTLNLSQRDRETNLLAENTFGDNPELTRQNIIQENVSNGSSMSYGVSLTYTEPIARRLYWETNYSFTQNDNISNQEVINTDSSGNTSLNPNLTNKFNSTYRYHRPGMNLKLNRTKFNLTVGVSLQETQLYAFLPLRDTRINRNFSNLLPVARFNYNFSNTKRLNLEYTTRVQEPTVQQLQPLVDNSDPLNISTGNPDLKPAYSHNIRASYSFFNPVNFMSVFVNARYEYQDNAIVNSQTVDDRLVRITKPVNVGENTVANTSLNFGFPIKKIKSRFRVGPSATRTTGLNLLNNQENRIEQLTIGGNINYQFNPKDYFEQNIGFRINQQQSVYSFNSDLNQVFFNQSITANSILTVKKKNILNASLDYLIYRNLNNGFYQELPLMNITVSRLMLKNDRGELKLSVINALDRNLGVTQDANVNFIETTRTNNLGRYYMVSFVYSINKHLDMMNQRGAGRMMRIMAP